MPIPAISLKKLNKTYSDGTNALTDISLDIHKGEIFGLLGPNGAGKTTMINIVAGLVRKTSGKALVFDRDVEKDYKYTRSAVGLVPQEVNLDSIFSIIEVLRFQQGYFNKKHDPKKIKEVLTSLQLWDKRDATGFQLSGGMRRRLMIAKALVHEPQIVFLDEPTAGVDVNLRHDLWKNIQLLREQHVTIVLTTHYIAEAELLADRIGIIDQGRLLKVDNKQDMIEHMGQQFLSVTVNRELTSIPRLLRSFNVKKGRNNKTIIFEHDEHKERMNEFFAAISNEGLRIENIESKKQSLEDIFLKILNGKK